MKDGRQRKSILITGGNGRLGKRLQAAFSNFDLFVPTRKELDITDPRSVHRYFKKRCFDIVIHAAALTNVDVCEKDPQLAWLINAEGTEHVVESVLKFSPQARFIYISTACVFFGDRGNYSENYAPHPKNMYGFTKIIAEYVVRRLENFLIIRTNFVDKAPWPYPHAFVDRYGTYLYATDVAAVTAALVKKQTKGLVHVAGNKKYSMYELAKKTTRDVKRVRLTRKNDYLTKDMSLTSIVLPSFPLDFSAGKKPIRL